MALIYTKEEKRLERLEYLTKSFELEKKILIHSTNYENYNLSVSTFASTLFRDYKQFEEAYRIFRDALTLPFNEKINELNHSLYSNYIDLLLKMGMDNKAVNQSKKLIAFYSQEGKFYNDALARLYIQLSLNYRLKNDYTKTIYYATKVLSSTEVNIRNQDLRSSANATLTTAYYEMQQYDKMRYYIFKDIEECKQTDPKLLADAYLYAGRHFATTFEDDLAYAYIDSAKHLYYNQLNLPYNRNIENNIALAYLELEQYTQCLHHLDNVSRVMKGNANYTNYFYWNNDFEKAKCYTKLNQLNRSKNLLIKTNASMRQKYPHLMDQASSIQGSQIGGLYRKITIGLVENLFLQYENSKDAQLLKEASTYIHEADNALDFLRTKQHYDRDRLVTGALYFDFTLQSTKVNIALYEITGEDKYLHQAFEFVQKGKSYALLQGVSEKRYKLNSGIPLKTINKLNKTKEQYDRLEKRYDDALLSNEIDSGLVANLNEKMGACISTIDSINAAIKETFPTYQLEKAKAPYLRLDEIQQRLGPNQIIFDYYQTDNLLYRFAINKTHYQCDAIKLDKQFEKNLQLVIQEVSTPFIGQHSVKHIQNFANASHQLYKTLISDIDSLIQGKELIIVPHAELSYLPFEILLTEDYSTEIPKFKNYPWLIKDQIISYSYNTAMLKNYTSEPKVFNKVLAFSPNYTGKLSVDSINLQTDAFLDTILKPLQGTKKEIAAIQESFSTNSFLNSKATKENFIAAMQNNDILHLAMHSLNDELNPFNSQLVFATKDSVSGSFKASEIYNYNINSPLIVLSSCSTGSGRKKKGEGLLSLARAFTYTGSDAQVMTLWPVNDVSGAKITELFYKRLSESKRKNKALQESKLEYLATADAIKSHPYYWANYVLAGNTQPIKQKMPKGIFVYLLAFAMLSVVILFLYDKRKRN